MQKQNVLPLTSKDPRSMWEEELKSRTHLEDRLAQLGREKAELLEQVSPNTYSVSRVMFTFLLTFYFFQSFLFLLFGPQVTVDLGVMQELNKSPWSMSL